MKHISLENNFYYLCGSLVVILFSSAIIVQFPDTWGKGVFSALIAIMLLLSIKSLHTSLTWKRMVWALAVIMLSLGLLNRMIPGHAINDYPSLLVLLLFFAGSLKSAWKQVLFVGRVDTNHIVGSLSLYLLLGLIWTVLYLILLQMDPSSLSGMKAESWQQAFPQVAYYSFVTLTTLGYGDILPMTPLARFFAYLEAIAGVFYMAIVVASLVSVRISGITHEIQDSGKEDRDRRNRG